MGEIDGQVKLYNVDEDDKFSAPLEAAADRTIGVEQTKFGPRFVGDDAETLVYPERHGMVQTTLDY